MTYFYEDGRPEYVMDFCEENFSEFLDLLKAAGILEQVVNSLAEEKTTLRETLENVPLGRWPEKIYGHWDSSVFPDRETIQATWEYHDGEDIQKLDTVFGAEILITDKYFYFHGHKVSKCEAEKLVGLLRLKFKDI